MKADDLTRHMIHELHLLSDGNEQSRAVVHAMKEASTDSVLGATLSMFLDILAEEHRLLQWLLEEQGQRVEDIPSRPVEVLARDGWLALEEGDDQLRDLEIATVATQLQSFHLASWFGVGSFLRVLDLQKEADVVDALTTELRKLEREIESLRPSLAQLDDPRNNSTEWYKPSARRGFGNFSSTSLKI
jgi:cell division protein FtsB